MKFLIYVTIAAIKTKYSYDSRETFSDLNFMKVVHSNSLSPKSTPQHSREKMCENEFPFTQPPEISFKLSLVDTMLNAPQHMLLAGNRMKTFPMAYLDADGINSPNNHGVLFVLT